MDAEERAIIATDFLDTIHQFNDVGWFSLARQDHDGEWVEEFWMNGNLGWPHREPEAFIQEAIEDKVNLFFSARTFTVPRRSNETATETRLLYADLDHSSPVLPKPWLRWTTSYGSDQCIWLANDTIVAEDHARYNRYLTYLSKADRGGWAASKMLRVPYSWSAKRGGWVGGPVTRHAESIDTTTLLPDDNYWDAAYAGLPESPQEELTRNEWAQLLHDEYNNIPNHIISELLSTTTDRSMKIWAVSRMMRDAGIPVDKAVALISGAGWNKWKGDVKKLARDVHKAYT